MTPEFVYNPPLFPFLDILHEDDDIMVVNKPSGLLSVPGRLKEYNDSILSRVRSIHPDAFAVHRLDLGTSGILVVGLNKLAVSRLGQQFMNRGVRKVYTAWTDGLFSGCGSIDLPLRLDVDHRPYQIVDFRQGKPALTVYEVLAQDLKLNRTLVRLYPKTGRSHQLRVHLKEIGHPILGEHLYADDRVRDCVPHLYLHAACLEFTHPRHGTLLRFASNPPFPLPEGICADISWLEAMPALQPISPGAF